MSDEPGNEIAVLPGERELAEGFAADLDVDASDLTVPILKVAQPLTEEVSDGEAKPGDFINALSGENFGGSVEFLVAGFYKGRFRVDRDTGEIICAGPTTQPDGSAALCGCHDLPYPECPDSEEQFKARVNSGQIEWGDGPPVSTTYNFLGFVIGSDMPVKLSLMRSSAKDGKKLVTLLKFSRAPWDQVFAVETQTRTSKAGGYKFQGVNIKQGRKATADERQIAVSLAQAVRSNRVNEVGDGDTTGTPAPEKPEGAKGGLDY